ncbi:uncharacterized protein EDB93DRAFT_1155909 [Suillus bovinus]|uniref:uncharacterized protein n=1 Tax=Suillus bovinus TaxID=48563 RepID=UPI001B87E708|nr:uncharacterized protein EDB93DRAFT_1155909 [Suillus bovinus]KAG2143397.1 hypothetical protein EDB93DRAFT_1155909 [Suillus bovinus]
MSASNIVAVIGLIFSMCTTNIAARYLSLRRRVPHAADLWGKYDAARIDQYLVLSTAIKECSVFRSSLYSSNLAALRVRLAIHLGPYLSVLVCHLPRCQL